jgi:hypothetical protein
VPDRQWWRRVWNVLSHTSTAVWLWSAGGGLVIAAIGTAVAAAAGLSGALQVPLFVGLTLVTAGTIAYFAPTPAATATTTAIPNAVAGPTPTDVGWHAEAVWPQIFHSNFDLELPNPSAYVRMVVVNGSGRPIRLQRVEGALTFGFPMAHHGFREPPEVSVQRYTDKDFAKEDVHPYPSRLWIHIEQPIEPHVAEWIREQNDANEMKIELHTEGLRLVWVDATNEANVITMRVLGPSEMR